MSPGVAGYRATRVVDKELVGPSMTYAMLQSMSAMPDHDKRSVEEMRYDAWSKAGEPGQASGQQGGFGLSLIHISEPRDVEESRMPSSA